MTTVEKIQAVQTVMAEVTVVGPKNWERMLACWNTLEGIKKELTEHENTNPAAGQRNSEGTADTV